MAGTVRGALANTVAGSPFWTPRFRSRLLRMFGVAIGRGARVYPYLRFVGDVDGLRVGVGAFINLGLVVGSGAPVTIGERAFIGPGVQLLPTSHEIGPSEARAGANLSRPIEIGAGAWLGAGVLVLGGVTVGGGCVVAAGAVVTEDCEPDGLYAGVPARRIRTLD
ncbi:acyltransferase [Agromyces binzhouensis]|uniref:acyltransferase n=1 Tax=Agromyces binzhouensis TaxID=1817495 RepID=UPI0036405A0E